MTTTITKHGKWLGVTKWVIAIIVFVITLLFAYFSYEKKEGFADIGTLLILGFTLVALIFYAFSTYEIAEVDKKTYEESKLPVVSLIISPEPKIILNYDTRVLMQNFSNYNLQAFMKLNLKVNGKPIEVGGAYSGDEAWFLTAQQQINGHFYIGDVLKKAGTDVAETKKDFLPENVKKQLCMSIEVYYRGVTREYDSSESWPHKNKNPKYKDSYTKWLGNPPQKWYFDFSRDVWVYDL